MSLKIASSEDFEIFKYKSTENDINFSLLLTSIYYFNSINNLIP